MNTAHTVDSTAVCQPQSPLPNAPVRSTLCALSVLCNLQCDYVLVSAAAEFFFRECSPQMSTQQAVRQRWYHKLSCTNFVMV
jgi:hypothetical protein